VHVLGRVFEHPHADTMIVEGIDRMDWNRRQPSEKISGSLVSASEYTTDAFNPDLHESEPLFSG